MVQVDVGGSKAQGQDEGAYGEGVQNLDFGGLSLILARSKLQAKWKNGKCRGLCKWQPGSKGPGPVRFLGQVVANWLPSVFILTLSHTDKPGLGRQIIEEENGPERADGWHQVTQPMNAIAISPDPDSKPIMQP